MPRSPARGETRACVTELQQRSSSKLPGYELLTRAPLGMSVPWSACVMPGEGSCRQRGSSKCFLYPGLSSPAGSHDPADHKPAPAVGHNSKVQTGVRECGVISSPTPTAGTAQTLWWLRPWALMAAGAAPPGPGLRLSHSSLDQWMWNLKSGILEWFGPEKTSEIIQPLPLLCRRGS